MLCELYLFLMYSCSATLMIAQSGYNCNKQVNMGNTRT